MKKNDLLASINSLSRDALGGNDTELATDRAKSMDRYYGKPYGNEREGRSSIVSRDLAETVDWIMPSLMRIFFQSGLPVEFDAVGKEDEPLAEQESDYTNYVITKQNNGFMVFYDVFKDALLLKNGYFKTYIEEVEDSNVEAYENLLEEQLMFLIQSLDDAEIEYEIIKQDERPSPEGVMYDIKIRITEKKNRVILEAVPPEKLRISKRCRGDLDKADYIEYFDEKTRSDLISMGMNRKFVEDLPASQQSHEDHEQQELSRTRYEDDYDEYETIDKSMELVEYRECYVFVDFDDDGKAERRKVIIVGNKIPDGDDWNEEVDMQPFSYLTPKRMPHRHVGESLDDDLKDLAEIKTALQRGMLDNTYGLTNTEWLVNKRVNLDDFLTSTPLGIKRVDDKLPVTGSAEPVIKPNILDKVLPCIGYFDGVLANRTGVKPGITGVDPDILQEVREKPFQEAASQANAKIEMIARLFAEVGVKDCFLKVHALIMKYVDKKEIVKLRGEYVTIDPREWKNRKDLTINVGLGTGTKDEIKANAILLSQAQEQLSQMGMVEPKHKYNTFVKLCKSLGELNPTKYVTDPNSPEFQQKMQNQKPPPNPMAEAEAVKAEAAKQIEQLRGQIKTQQLQADNQFKSANYQMDHQHKMASLENDIANTQLKAQELALKAEELGLSKLSDQLQAEANTYKAQADERNSELKKYEIDRKTETDLVKQSNDTDKDLQIARLNAAVAIYTSGEKEGNLDQVVEAANGDIERLIEELSKPRKVMRDEEGRIDGLE